MKYTFYIEFTKPNGDESATSGEMEKAEISKLIQELETFGCEVTHVVSNYDGCL